MLAMSVVLQFSVNSTNLVPYTSTHTDIALHMHVASLHVCKWTRGPGSSVLLRLWVLYDYYYVYTKLAIPVTAWSSSSHVPCPPTPAHPAPTPLRPAHAPPLLAPILHLEIIERMPRLSEHAEQSGIHGRFGLAGPTKRYNLHFRRRGAITITHVMDGYCAPAALE
jgi:hypothetical protein